MPSYRTYLLDKAEHIESIIELEADDDAGALTEALARGGECAALEVWEQARLVVRVGAEFQLETRV